MKSYLNKSVLVGVRKGVVVSEHIGKKGKLRVVVQFADGSTEEMGHGVVHVQEVCGPAGVFEPATGTVKFEGVRDFYGDRARMSARW